MAKTRSRTVLTSGSLEPVLDDGANGHSIFANALIAALSENDGVLYGSKLYSKVNEKVQQATRNMDFKQAPQYAPIKFSGHEAGDFFLVRNQQISSKEQTYIVGHENFSSNVVVKRLRFLASLNRSVTL